MKHIARTLALTTAMAPVLGGWAMPGGNSLARQTFAPASQTMVKQVEIAPRQTVAVVEGQVDAAHALCGQYGLRGDDANAARLIRDANPGSRNHEADCLRAGYAR